MAIHVGTSGWSYGHWENVLYPPSTPPAARLALYTRRFSTVELNASFYRWPADRTFAGWKRRLPEGFQLSVKASRGLTHAKRLSAPEAWVDRMARCWHELGPRRGVLLVQLGPGHARDDARLEYFLTRLPDWMRVAVEFRHPSWHHDAVLEILERRQVGYCVMSGADLPCLLRVTAPFVYVRLHGPDRHHLYGGSYSEGDLHWWPTGSGSGTAADETSTPTSTTTAMAMRCATPTPCAHSCRPEPAGPPCAVVATTPRQRNAPCPRAPGGSSGRRGHLAANTHASAVSGARRARTECHLSVLRCVPWQRTGA